MPSLGGFATPPGIGTTTLAPAPADAALVQLMRQQGYSDIEIENAFKLLQSTSQPGPHRPPPGVEERLRGELTYQQAIRAECLAAEWMPTKQ